MIKAWKKYSAYSKYSGSLITNMQGRWAVLILLIMVSTLFISIFQDLNYVAVPVMVAGGITVIASATGYSMVNNPKLELYPISKARHAVYIFISHFGIILVLFPIFAHLAYFMPMIYSPSLISNLSRLDMQLEYIFNNFLLLLNTLTLFVGLLPSLFIEDKKEWFIRMIVPLVIHSVLFYFATNLFTNNYSFVLGSFTLPISWYITLIIFVVWLLYNVFKSYKIIVEKL